MNKENPLLTSVLIGSGALIGLNIISPSFRKITHQTTKLIYNHQVKLLAGIGILSIANYISNMDDDIYTIDDI